MHGRTVSFQEFPHKHYVDQKLACQVLAGEQEKLTYFNKLKYECSKHSLVKKKILFKVFLNSISENSVKKIKGISKSTV